MTKHKKTKLHGPKIPGRLKQEADLKATKTVNLIAPIIVRKTVHLIDSIIKTQEGIYRKPKKTRYRQTVLPKAEIKRRAFFRKRFPL